jgi:EpsI family protein
VLLGAGAAALAARAARPDAYMADDRGIPDLERLFPAHVGDWRVDASIPVVLPSPDLQARLNQFYNQVLSRTYVDSTGYRIMLSVAYGGDQSDGTRAHRPEGCYPGQGFQITASRVGAVDLGGRRLRIRRLMARLGARHEPISYWIVVGDSVALSGTEQKLVQLGYGMRGLVADGMLVRVSSIDRDMQAAYPKHDRFIVAAYRQMGEQTAQRVFGRGAQA